MEIDREGAGAFLAAGLEDDALGADAPDELQRHRVGSLIVTGFHTAL